MSILLKYINNSYINLWYKQQNIRFKKPFNSTYIGKIQLIINQYLNLITSYNIGMKY